MPLPNYTQFVYEHGFFQDGILMAFSSSGNWVEFKKDLWHEQAIRLNTNQPFNAMYSKASGAYSYPCSTEKNTSKRDTVCVRVYIHAREGVSVCLGCVCLEKAISSRVDGKCACLTEAPEDSSRQ